jgi:hypothetical protein
MSRNRDVINIVCMRIFFEHLLCWVYMHVYLQQLQEVLRYGHGVELVARDTFCCNVGLMVLLYCM